MKAYNSKKAWLILAQYLPPKTFLATVHKIISVMLRTVPRSVLVGGGTAFNVQDDAEYHWVLDVQGSAEKEYIDKFINRSKLGV